MAFDKTRFGGVVAPIVNPCGEDDSLDRGALEANLTPAAGNGCCRGCTSTAARATRPI